MLSKYFTTVAVWLLCCVTIHDKNLKLCQLGLMVIKKQRICMQICPAFELSSKLMWISVDVGIRYILETSDDLKHYHICTQVKSLTYIQSESVSSARLYPILLDVITFFFGETTYIKTQTRSHVM